MDSWDQAIAAAERGLRGDTRSRAAVERETAAFVRANAAMTDPETVGRLAHLVALLDALGLRQLSRIAVDHAVEWALSGETPHTVGLLPVRYQLVRMLAGRGSPADLDNAGRLLSLPLAETGAPPGLAGAATLAGFAALRLRLGPSAAATELTASELARIAWDRLASGDQPHDERVELEARLLVLSVLLEENRRGAGPAVAGAAEQLAAETESVCRRLVELLGGEHPRCLAALVTLSAAEFEAARAAGAHDRAERAVDVLALVAQRSAATLGRDHPQSTGALAMLACVEYEAAQDAGDEDRMRRAADMVRSAAERVGPPDSDGALAQGAPGASVRFRFAVLGPVRAWRGEHPLPMGSPQQKAVLAALLLRSGRVVTTEELVHAVWGEDPPEQAKVAVRTYASRVRKSLGADAEVLVRESGGYALRLGPGDVLDLDIAHVRAEGARRAAGGGDLRAAREEYAAALAQWEGEPLAQVPGPYAQAQRTRLEEWRLGLLEHRLDLDLQDGCHAEAVSELTALTAVHPLRERLRELLMLALYRSGRQAEALAVYADTRRLLANQLGLDPRPELADLQRRILQADEELDLRPDATSATGGDTRVRPAQLPATVGDFTGRTHLVAELADQLTGEGPRVSAVAGIGGVGKTTLAVEVAHVVSDRFPDGQLYADLQRVGAGPVDPETVLGAFLRALGTAPASVPDGAGERAALFRSLLAGRRVLVVLDNARDAAQVRALLPGTAGCAALVTSRTRMVDLAGAHLVDLDVMSPQEGMALFTRIVGEERVTAERGAAVDVVAACGFQPGAIRIAAARLASRRTWAVSVLARKLADERRRLDELRAGDQGVAASFQLGYGQLEPQQARAFRLLGLVEGPDISVHAAAALLGLPEAEAEPLLEALVDTTLLESAAPGRYRLHDLVRLFARARAEQDEQPGEGEAALSRLLDFYLATARNAFARTRPAERLIHHLEPGAGAGLRFSTQRAALDWLLVESDCFLACARQLATGETLRRAVDLLVATSALAESGVGNQRYEETVEALQAAAEAAGDALAEARTCSTLTGLLLAAGRFEAAEEQAHRALLRGSDGSDPLSTSYAQYDLGIVALQQARYDEARARLEAAREDFRLHGGRGAEAGVLCNLSRAHVGLGAPERAVALAEEALRLGTGLDGSMRRAQTLYALGSALTAARRPEQAEGRYEEALVLFRESRQRVWEGMTHHRLGEVSLALDRPAQAAAQAEQALGVIGAFGDPWRRGLVLTLLGRALDAVGQVGRARACWHEALALFEQLGSDHRTAELAALLGAGVTV